MRRRLARDGALAAVTLVVVSIVVYAATLVIPADPAKVFLGRTATEQQLEAFRSEQGLDRGPVDGYMYWASRFIRGDWGRSVISQEPVTDLVLPRLGRSFVLVLLSFGLALPLAVALGVYGGSRAGSRTDLALSVGVLGLAALPEFIVAIVLLYVLAVQLGLLPVSSSAATAGGWQAVKAYILPAVSLALIITPHILRQVRVVVRELAAAPFVQAAELRGLSSRRVRWRHVFPVASGRIVNVAALNFAELLAGAVIVETVFGFPGIGRGLIEAIDSNDVTIIQASALIISAFYITTNFVADGLVVVLNPRIRLGRQA